MILIDFFKSKDWRDARDKFDKQKAELQEASDRAKQLEKHAAMLTRMREGHMVYLSKLRQINKARKKKPAVVRHMGVVDILVEQDYRSATDLFRKKFSKKI